ncbi:MAG TPA: hypothetical protein VGH76_26300 [Actinomycetospora sp.]|jgi:hypothetical protein|uniref:hypothetical protein n=1 Tax=Actinomycetospora sp. TaxID=1872135 RepID=UPI002F409096
MADRARKRLRTEIELREAEAMITDSWGVSLDESAQALKNHADLMRVSVADLARLVICRRAAVAPTHRRQR